MTSLEEMLDERRHLLDTAAWMLGPSTADQVVQETYRRWYALDDHERAAVPAPRAWLTRVAGGICLDLLAGRSTSLPDRPTPVTPARPEPADPALLASHDHVARRFATACNTGDTTTLTAVLASDAMVVSDGGGKVRAPLHPTNGAASVAAYVTGLLAGRRVAVESVNGRTGLVLHHNGQAVAVISLSVADAQVTAVWIVLNPDKLHRWQSPMTPQPPSTGTPIHTAHVTVSGGTSAHGRATGRAHSSDGALDLHLRTPHELGGDTTGPNPEQLFAAGFAACLHGALSLLAREHSLDPAPIAVEACVALGRDPADGAYKLQADLRVSWSGADLETAELLLAEAITLSPYAKMTSQGIPATITLVPPDD